GDDQDDQGHPAREAAPFQRSSGLILIWLAAYPILVPSAKPFFLLGAEFRNVDSMRIYKIYKHTKHE
ncbi:unnamed protein product, partial [Durusdinium trenchii]